MADRNVYVVGSGGREQAIANALRANCAVTLGDGSDVADDVGLVIVGPEQPLVEGLADRLRARGLHVVGPSAAAAALEGSKAFMKAVLAKAAVPTAAYGEFDDLDSARAYLNQVGAPIVLKTDGLAAGKGVVVCQTLAQAEAELGEYFDGKFGRAGQRVIIEEFLEGPEISVFYLVGEDQSVRLLGSAQDHKRLLDGDQGPNTGGMGTFAPSPLFSDALADALERDFIQPTLAEMRHRGMPFQGLLFAGLMLTNDGPKLLEYNVRLGDPETQSLLPLIDGDLFEIFTNGAEAKLTDGCAVTVVIAANGYPFAPEKGGIVCSALTLDEVNAREGVTVTVAGAKREGERWIATGGRVLGITALADTFEQARTRAYAAVEAVGWAGGQYRTDIGARL